MHPPRPPLPTARPLRALPPAARTAPVARTAPAVRMVQAAPADHMVPLGRLDRMVLRAIKRCCVSCWVPRHAIVMSIRRFVLAFPPTDRPLTKDN